MWSINPKKTLCANPLCHRSFKRHSGNHQYCQTCRLSHPVYKGRAIYRMGSLLQDEEDQLQRDNDKTVRIWTTDQYSQTYLQKKAMHIKIKAKNDEIPCLFNAYLAERERRSW